MVNPIIDWKDYDVWDFLGEGTQVLCGTHNVTCNGIHVNPLYDEGWCRVGCVGCPMASKARVKEFIRWPKYKQLYINAFDRMLEERKRRGRTDGSWGSGFTGQDIFNWWMEYDILPGQIDMFEFLEEDDED